MNKLQEALKVADASSKAREVELLNEIAVLRRQVPIHVRGRYVFSFFLESRLMYCDQAVFSPSPVQIPHLLEAYEGEMSMELATPLLPTNSLPRSRSRSRSQTPSNEDDIGLYVDPPSIPLPPSPSTDSLGIRHIEPLPSEPVWPVSSSVSPPLSSSSQAEQNLQRVERELSVARRRLQESGDAISDLQQVIKRSAMS